MSKVNKIIYWIATLWLALGMTSTAIVQLLSLKAETDFMTKLGYPAYSLKILGVWKILGVIAVLAPRFPLLKEWAYAGFFFMMSGAFCSHLITGDTMKDTFPSLLLLVLTVISWYFRPAERRLLAA
ncbi:DoxX family protein [Chitinophaga qingshengii]|uniref:DoxX family protein n=1 Tax=Chitinophaga qingshengii TaxID=1569794 RepID=A0ABR7TR50_9BACT|nr:DoxX family protein [Chitinophaga qingshengii]MBC9932974.1 DoxX family protein [Chitinophaga qingshengii]